MARHASVPMSFPSFLDTYHVASPSPTLPPPSLPLAPFSARGGAFGQSIQVIVRLEGSSRKRGDDNERRVVFRGDVGCEVRGGCFEDFRLEGVDGEEGEFGSGFVECRLPLGELLGAGRGKDRGTEEWHGWWCVEW